MCRGCSGPFRSNRGAGKDRSSAPGRRERRRTRAALPLRGYDRACRSTRQTGSRGGRPFCRARAPRSFAGDARSSRPGSFPLASSPMHGDAASDSARPFSGATETIEGVRSGSNTQATASLAHDRAARTGAGRWRAASVEPRPIRRESPRIRSPLDARGPTGILASRAPVVPGSCRRHRTTNLSVSAESDPSVDRVVGVAPVTSDPPHDRIRLDQASPAFSRLRRREAPTTPMSPVPSNSMVPGSGVATGVPVMSGVMSSSGSISGVYGTS